MPKALDQSGGAEPIVMLEQRFPKVPQRLCLRCPDTAPCHRLIAACQSVLVVKRACLPAALIGGVELPCLPDGIERPTVERENNGPAKANVVEFGLRTRSASLVVTPIPMFHRH